MELTLTRRWPKSAYTIGILSFGGCRFCESCEDTDRALKASDPLDVIRAVKVPGETAIPAGRYRVRMDRYSPKYGGVEWYRKLTGGYMPYLEDVPGFEGILIHPGSSALDSQGCILVGRNTVKGGLTSSRDTFSKLYQRLREAHDRGEEITIEIISTRV